LIRQRELGMRACQRREENREEEGNVHRFSFVGTLVAGNECRKRAQSCKERACEPWSR
jgi:hypothetical protein